MAGASFVFDIKDSVSADGGEARREGLIGEFCKGFQLLMDRERGVITFDNQKRNALALGLQGLSDEQLRSMISAGDCDGDGALSEMQCCDLMFRLNSGADVPIEAAANYLANWVVQ